MADTVNGQVTDSVTQTNVQVVAESPALSLGNLYQVTSQSLGNSAHNATIAQQQGSITAQAATSQGVAMLYAVGSSSLGQAVQEINEE